jgi:hypothetical protein
VTGRLLDWLGLAAVITTAALAGLLEALLVPLYAGTVVVPLSVVLAIGGNLLFPRLARALVPTTPASALPVLAWLLVVMGFGAFGRPEGDVVLPGAPSAVEWVTYGVLLGGAAAGVTAVVRSIPGPAPRAAAGRFSR